MAKHDDRMLAVFTVADTSTGEHFLEQLERIAEHERYATITDAAVVSKSEKGKLKVHQTKDMGAAKGGLGGGAIGVVAGAILLGPAGAVVGGAVAGTLAGVYARLRDIGINDKQMKQIAAEIDGGKAAVFVQYVGDWSQARGAIADAARMKGATLFFSTLPEERIAQVREWLGESVEQLGGEETTSDYEVDAQPEAEEVSEPVVDPAVAALVAAPAAEAVAGDDLTKIKGLGPKTSAVLLAAGIDTYEKLAGTSEPDVRRVFADANVPAPANVATFAMQASFAARGDWPGLYAFNQKFKAESAKAEEEAQPVAAPDDLTQLAGIGPKVAAALAETGYRTYDDLANASEPQLRDAIRHGGMPAPASLPTWPMQAAYAAKGDWQGLNKYNQKWAHGKPASTTTAAAAPEQHDDLTQISGIGPRMSSLLGAGGITSYAQLERTSPDELRQIAAAGGVLPSASMASWPTQAAYAARGDWEGLATYNRKH